MNDDDDNNKELSLDDFEFVSEPLNRQLTPLSGIGQEPAMALDKGQFIGSGTFCRVYALSETKVVKFSWDLETLQLLQRLAEKSPFFPVVYDLHLEEQAENERGVKYYAAVVERLHPAPPKWTFDLVTHYRQPWPAVSCHQSAIRLHKVRHQVLTGKIVVDPALATGLAEALGLLSDECMTNQFVADLRTDTNIMSRSDGHVVISDPAHPQKYMPDDY